MYESKNRTLQLTDERTAASVHTRPLMHPTRFLCFETGRRVALAGPPSAARASAARARSAAVSVGVSVLRWEPAEAREDATKTLDRTPARRKRLTQLPVYRSPYRSRRA